MRRSAWFVAVLLTLVFGLLLTAAAPQRTVTKWRSEATAGAVISPVVVASWILRWDETDKPVLDLIILWRGSPGWFSRGSSAGGSTGGGEGKTELTQRYGDLEFRASFDSKTKVAQVLGREVPLTDANVILIDDIDATPKLVETLSIDASDIQRPFRVQTILKKSPKVISYLRCDVKLTDARIQPVMDLLCGLVTDGRH